MEPLADPSPTPDPGEPCTLWLDVPNLRAVAEGLVFRQATVHHHSLIPANLQRVTVIYVFEGEGDTELPILDREIMKLAHAVGSFILWPTHLIYPVAPMV